ncbi:mediator of RNA polymerase II transcription subunit 27-like [Styela clava]
MDFPSIPQAKHVLNMTNQAIAATQQLRTTVTNVFEFLRDGMNADENSTQSSSNQFLQRYQELLQAVNKDFTELEKLGNAMTTVPELSVTPLGPAGQLGMESSADDNSLFQNTLLAYQWYTKSHSRGQIAHSTFHAYKRTTSTSATSLLKARRGLVSNPPQTVKPHHFPANQLDNYLSNMLPRQVPDLSIKVIFSLGSTRILHITVEHVFFALISFKSLYIEKIIVRGLDEDILNQAENPDMFTSSRYECMRQITDHATSALLYVDHYPQLQIDLKPRFILTWLQNYKTLFSDSCNKCGKILSAGVPPTWRDFKTHAPYHSTCK